MQLTAAVGARSLGVASLRNRDYLQGLSLQLQAITLMRLPNPCIAGPFVSQQGSARIGYKLFVVIPTSATVARC